MFETPIIDVIPEEARKALAAEIPCPKRLGQPDEFGRLVGTIIENPMLNGTFIRLDGAMRY